MMKRLLLLFLMPGWLYMPAALHAQANTEWYPAKSGGKWGFIDRTGKMVIAPEYDHVAPFERGRAIVQLQGLVGMIDSTGRLEVPCKYRHLSLLNDTLLLVREERDWKIQSLDASRIYLYGITGEIRLLPGGYLIHEQITGMGLAHLERGQIVQPEYHQIEPAGNDYFRIYKKGKQGLVQASTGKMLLEALYDSIGVGGNYFGLRKDNKWGLADSTGAWIVPPVWEQATALNSYFWELRNSKKRVVYSAYCQKIIKEQVQSIDTVRAYPHWIQLTVDNKVCIIDTVGNVVVPPRYKEVQLFAGNIMRFREDQLWGLFDRERDTVLLPAQCEFINDPARTVAVASKGNRQGILRLDGSWALPPEHESLSLMNNVVYFKNAKDNRMMTWSFDEAGNLDNEELYNNYHTIKIRPGGSVNTASAAAGRLATLGTDSSAAGLPEYVINDSLIWFFEPRSRLWGIKNKLTDRIKLSPQYSTYRNYRDLGFSIVSRSKMEIGGKLEWEGQDLVMDAVYGIVHNERALPITKMEFLDIEIEDITQRGLPVARCIFVGGRHGLIAKSGKVLASNFAFIGEFVEGKARACPKGTLLVDVRGWQPRHFGKASDYINGIQATKHFSAMNNPSIQNQVLDVGVLYCEEGKWGFLDTTGRMVITAQYDYADDFHQNSAMVRREGKWGLIDGSNQLLLPIEYDDLDYLPNSDRRLLLAARHQALSGMIDTAGKVIIPVQYERLHDFSEGMAAVRKSTRWGFVNTEGKEVIPCDYRVVQDFHQGLAAVQHRGRWGFMDKSGAWVIQPKYSAVGNFKDGLVWVREGSKYRYINASGETVIEGDFAKLYDFEDGLARAVSRSKGAGILRSDGSWLLKPQKHWSDIGPFDTMGIARAKIETRYELVSRSGEQPTRRAYAEIRPFSEGYAVVRPYSPSGNHRSGYGIIDSAGKLVVQPRYDVLGDVHCGRAWFKENGKFGYLDVRQGKVLVPATYHAAYDFEDDRALVYTEYKHSGIIDLQGNYVVQPLVNKIVARHDGVLLVKQAYDQYFYASEDLKRLSSANYHQAQPFRFGVAPICRDRRWGIVNEQGMYLGALKYDRMEPLNEQGLSRVTVNRWEGVVDLQGKIIVPPLYEYIEYVGNGLFRIEQNNRLGYLDDQGKWRYEMKD